MLRTRNPLQIARDMVDVQWLAGVPSRRHGLARRCLRHPGPWPTRGKLADETLSHVSPLALSVAGIFIGARSGGDDHDNGIEAQGGDMVASVN